MKWLKKYFIPNRGNNYKPHIWREAGATVVFVFVVMLFLGAVSGHLIITHTDLTALVLPKVLVDYANEDRLNEKYRELAINPVLEKAAQLKANDMATKGYFAHKSPEGRTPWYWFDQAGYDFTFAGENLAVNFVDSVDVNKAWMNSPGHRANIMNNSFTEIGVATAEGVYEGRRTVFVVQLFGRPAIRDRFSITRTNSQATSTSKAKATTSAAVLSESASRETVGINGESELYISVKKESAVLGTTSIEKYSNFFQKIILSPKKLLAYTYTAIAGIILFGLSFMFFIEVKKRNVKMILLAIGLLVVIIGLFYLYKAVLFAPLIIV